MAQPAAGACADCRSAHQQWCDQFLYCVENCQECFHNLDCENCPGNPDRGCHTGDHVYLEFACPSSGAACCFSCSVEVTDESRAEGVFTCRNCKYTCEYLKVWDRHEPHHI